MTKNRLLIFLGVVALMFAAYACSSSTKTVVQDKVVTEQIAEAKLISRELLFGNPDISAVKVSPDGKYISYMADVEGVRNVFVGPIDDFTKAKAITNNKGRGVPFYFWAYKENTVLFGKDNNGDENWRIIGINVVNKEMQEYTPEGSRAQILSVSHKIPNEIMIGINDRNPQFHDAYRINLTTGEKTLIFKNDEYVGFNVDDNYKVRFAYEMRPDGGSDVLKVLDDGKTELFFNVPSEDMLTTQIVGFDKEATSMYLLDSRERNTTALFSVNLETGERKLLAEDAKADINNIIVHPVSKVVQIVSVEYERKKWIVLDESVKADHDYLTKVAKGNVWITSRSLDDKTWIIAYEQDNGPVLYYSYDRDAKKATFMASHRKALENVKLSSMHSVVIKSRDGLDLVSYYSLPVGLDNNGKTEKPLPMVLVVHGGPWHRDSWGYNSLHQWLANRGYAVLSVNFRGSTGFGKSFTNAGDKEWGGKMHNDLIDAVDWAVAEGIADPEKIAIFGGSYGGYATLVGVTMTPDKFACGVDIVGPSNLVTFLNSVPVYWKPMIEMFKQRIGDHSTDDGKEFLMSRSPITYVNDIKKPLLIGQGANDPRVVKAESDQIVEAMRKNNIPVTYVLYPNEGHGFMQPENKKSFFAIADVFLGSCLGGEVEEIGDDLEGSTLKVPAGKELVQGLEQGLKN